MTGRQIMSTAGYFASIILATTFGVVLVRLLFFPARFAVRRGMKALAKSVIRQTVRVPICKSKHDGVICGSILWGHPKTK
jgi:hypothetical protein